MYVELEQLINWVADLFTVSLPWLISRISLFFKNPIEKESNDLETDSDEKESGFKMNSNAWLVLAYLIIAALVYLKFTEMPSLENNSSINVEEKKLNDIQRRMVLLEYESVIRVFANKNGLKNFSNISDKNYYQLREKLWNKMVMVRNEFSQLALGKKVNDMVKRYYTQARFNRDYDSFMDNNSECCIEDFILAMKDFVQPIQNEITAQVMQ